MYLCVFRLSSALIVQWLGHLVVAEKTWVRFPLGAHNTHTDDIGVRFFSFLQLNLTPQPSIFLVDYLLPVACNVSTYHIGNKGSCFQADLLLFQLHSQVCFLRLVPF